MNDSNGVVMRRRSLKERLRLRRIGCCGATCGLRQDSFSDRDDGRPEELQLELVNTMQDSPEIRSTPDCYGQTPGRSGVSLATALAAERQYRTAQDIIEDFGINPGSGQGESPIRPINETRTRQRQPGTPYRVSLMRLLEETEAHEEDQSTLGTDSLCCVCMVRKKGAAFIPCGHTFCRVCSRELWLNRGTCPLCSRTIEEVLDIF